MSDNINLDLIKERISKLLVRTTSNGCTEAEAEAAMKMVGSLLEKYDLSMSEIDLRKEDCEEIGIDTGSKKRNGMDKIAVCIGLATGTKVWLTKDGNAFIKFFGLKPDVLMAKFLYETISNNLKFELNLFMKNYQSRMIPGVKKTYRTSFQMGYTQKMNERLRKMASDRKAAQVSSGTSLMILKDQIVTEAFANLNMKLKVPYQTYKPQIRSTAWQQGNIAGEKANLNRPVGQSERNGLIA